MRLKKIVHDILKKLPGGNLIENFLDQLLHMVWGANAAGLLIAAVHHAGGDAGHVGVLAYCMLAPLVVALPRELVDQWPIESVTDTLVDTVFFMVGGGLTWLIVV